LTQRTRRRSRRRRWIGFGWRVFEDGVVNDLERPLGIENSGAMIGCYVLDKEVYMVEIIASIV